MRMASVFLGEPAESELCILLDALEAALSVRTRDPDRIGKPFADAYNFAIADMREAAGVIEESA
jgi:hypothetical protein